MEAMGSNIHDEAKPQGSTSLRPSQLGCWRSHADVWKRVVAENLLTALVLEDDADWDVEIQESMGYLSRQMRIQSLRSTRPSKHELQVAPYGIYRPFSLGAPQKGSLHGFALPLANIFNPL